VVAAVTVSCERRTGAGGRRLTIEAAARPPPGRLLSDDVERVLSGIGQPEDQLAEAFGDQKAEWEGPMRRY